MAYPPNREHSNMLLSSAFHGAFLVICRPSAAASMGSVHTGLSFCFLCASLPICRPSAAAPMGSVHSGLSFCVLCASLPICRPSAAAPMGSAHSGLMASPTRLAGLLACSPSAAGGQLDDLFSANSLTGRQDSFLAPSTISGDPCLDFLIVCNGLTAS